MAWNEPGNGKDPWKRDDNEPNDLDQIVQQWQRRLSGSLLGGGGKSPGGAGGYVLIILMLVAWAATGIYRVDEAERGVVQRFGAYTKTTMPGLHWHLPYPIERVDVVNTVEINNFPFRTEILTADEQYVFIQMVVQYRRDNPVDYSFEVVDPEVHGQGRNRECAQREVIGTNNLEDLVTGDRDEIARGTLRNAAGYAEQLQGRHHDRVRQYLQPRLSRRQCKPPSTIRRKRPMTAHASGWKPRPTANDIVPRARGDAARIRRGCGGLPGTRHSRCGRPGNALRGSC